jgi:hypothetical protein
MLAMASCLETRTHAQRTDHQTLIKEKDGTYSIAVQGQVMKMDPAKGGRITALLFNGNDFLTDSTINDFNWGSTFWPSPQSDWNWPPPAEIDNKPYRVMISGNTIRMTSLQDPKTGIVVEKEISGNINNQSFTVKYSMINHSGNVRKVAPWEITRVKTNGIAFFPTGKDQARGGLLPSTMVQNGIFWYVYQKDKLPVKGDRQIYADGSEGWLAQLNDDMILIKKFPDISLDETAPKEGEVELFASEVSPSNPGYVEIEHQGVYKTLQPGDTLTWETSWFLRKLPPAVSKQPGNSELPEFVRKIVK